jgi:hypothetical protein
MSMRAKKTRPIAKVIALPTEKAHMRSLQIGRLVNLDETGNPVVDLGPGPITARSIVHCTAKEYIAAARRGDEVLLGFENDNLGQPVILGFIAKPSLEHTPPLAEVSLSSLPEMARVDGKRVCIEGADEIVLCCGEASVTLRRNGKVVIRGVQLESDARGSNRIKGGSVEVN